MAAKRAALERQRTERLAAGAADRSALVTDQQHPATCLPLKLLLLYECMSCGAQATEREVVEAVRLEKLKGLEAAGVPPKYRAELASKRLVNW
jgi:hypothetical protein